MYDIYGALNTIETNINNQQTERKEFEYQKEWNWKILAVLLLFPLLRLFTPWKTTTIRESTYSYSNLQLSVDVEKPRTKIHQKLRRNFSFTVARILLHIKKQKEYNYFLPFIDQNRPATTTTTRFIPPTTFQSIP